MKVWTRLSESGLYDIAEEIGVCIADRGSVNTRDNSISKVGRAYSFNLRPDKRTRNADGDYRYQRVSASVFHDERRIFAVCWHGHRDFMRGVFMRDPEARIKSARMGDWDYKGREDFEERHEDSGYVNVGSLMYPRYASDVCKCGGW